MAIQIKGGGNVTTKQQNDVAAFHLDFIAFLNSYSNQSLNQSNLDAHSLLEKYSPLVIQNDMKLSPGDQGAVFKLDPRIACQFGPYLKEGTLSGILIKNVCANYNYKDGFPIQQNNTIDKDLINQCASKLNGLNFGGLSNSEQIMKVEQLKQECSPKVFGATLETDIGQNTLLNGPHGIACALLMQYPTQSAGTQILKGSCIEHLQNNASFSDLVSLFEGHIANGIHV